MLSSVEWREADPPPDGRISIQTRMNDAEALAILAAPRPTDPAGASIYDGLVRAVAAGELLIPS